MPDVDWILYDTAPFTIAAAGQLPLYQIPQGGDAVHTEDFCNTPGAGSLPANQNFMIKAIAIYPEPSCLQVDIDLVFNRSYVEIIVADKVMLKAPMAYFAAPQSFGGSNGIVLAALATWVSYSGPLFEMVIPIPIPGGTPFRVNITQVVGISANTQVKCLLIGTLTRP